MKRTEKYNLKIDGKEIKVETNSLAVQSNGSVLVTCGETVVLATAVMSDQDKDDLGYFPLTVDYQEKFYAGGKIKGSRFQKREARPSDEAILNSRLIDRSIRPRFNKDLKREVQVIATVLSWDGENDSDVLSLIASSIALSISDIPWNGPVGAVRVAKKDGQLILNPSYNQQEDSDMDIVFVGLFEGKEFVINMIEGGLNEASESDVLSAYDLAESHIKKIIEFSKTIAEDVGQKKFIPKPAPVDEELDRLIEDFLGNKYREAFFSSGPKEQRAEALAGLENSLLALIEEKYPQNTEKIKYTKDFLYELANKLVHEGGLRENKRVDGRKFDEVRKITAKTSVLPRAHGTGLFTRGETTALSVLTLGAPGDQQLIEGMEVSLKKRFMHHYNFPPYSVGEASFLRGPGRREIGHGALAEKALSPLVPDPEEFPYTIRIVSEIMSSNGSSSMASTSGSALALMDAGVPIKRLVTGVAMGLIKEGSDYKIMTDIQGPEDHHGDMDFKVAGTRDGITAIQLDVKIEGISRQIIAETLDLAKKARYNILDVMEKEISSPRAKLSKYAPKILTLQIDSAKIGEVIGPGGKVINAIIDETGAAIDIEDSGLVFVTAEDSEAAKKALDWIAGIVAEAEIGKTYQGEVKKVADFGAFVEILPGKDGLVHISKLADRRVEKVTDVVKVGDMVRVKVLSIDDQGRVNLKLEK